jgi:hypothetical protein
MKVVVLVAAVVLLAACASRYAPPSDLSASVPVTFVNRGPAAVTYVRSSAEECSTTSDAGFVGVVGKVKVNLGSEALEKPSRLSHSRPVTVSMGWWDTGPIRECSEKVTFSPRSQFEYQIEYVSESSSSSTVFANVTSCSIQIRERAVGSTGAFSPFAGEVLRARRSTCIK